MAFKLIDFGVKVLVWAVLFILVSLCWVGAEVIFEGCYHSSVVDGGVAGALAFYIEREILRFEEKIVKGRKNDD